MSSSKPPQSTKTKTSTKSQQITFRFSKLCLDNVPFCHKTLSLKFHSKFFNQGTNPTPVDNFTVQWINTIEIKKNITCDASGKLLPANVDLTVFTHTVKGSGKDEVAYGVLDLSQLARSGSKSGSVQMRSSILESTLTFEIEMVGDSFIEAHKETKQEELPKLPEIIPISKNSWFNMKHNPDLIEQDANMLVEAALKPKVQPSK
ncbi:hypothetical protein TRFO_18214 [Tritrichomonas foetus]|uniref:C2 NT-type domain-containing protein n=1 Tax=Tritrichomonas foetus TaxID=1144522 RepID=A0A1J4KRD8_9EUKA|nr:hypothetical protein TRFO_18214 [Tritrichomonas foetus]|eukprot:OHT12029.1 hypothetical protein TRFO_18214 [Tritrichomonas foetus]